MLNLADDDSEKKDDLAAKDLDEELNGSILLFEDYTLPQKGTLLFLSFLRLSEKVVELDDLCHWKFIAQYMKFTQFIFS